MFAKDEEVTDMDELSKQESEDVDIDEDSDDDFEDDEDDDLLEEVPEKDTE